VVAAGEVGDGEKPATSRLIKLLEVRGFQLFEGGRDNPICEQDSYKRASYNMQSGS
jgi:hypothetical protein